MKVLVTGGTGVIGEGVIPELLQQGHQVRLLSRHADDDAKQWENVEAFGGNVADPESMRDAAAGCDAVLHIAGIAKENPPKLTFQSINIDGTRNVIEEAKRAGVKSFVYVSSLGADIGTSEYHKSKLAAEKLVQQSGLQWTIVRPGNVYGPGDEVISLMLKLIRVAPVVPVIDDGSQEFQPIWYEDLAKILAATLIRNDVRGQVLEAAGSEITTMNDLLSRLGKLTNRSFARVPVPMSLASLTTRIASMAIDVPIDQAQLTMLQEKNVVRGTSAAAVLGVQTTPLDHGLARLADSIPEILPEEGFGSMEHKRFWADIKGAEHSATSLMSIFRERVNDIMPIEFAAEPGSPERVEKGTSMTGNIPGRGNFQVRTEIDDPTRIVFATLEGHPLAGVVEFSTSDVPGGVRFAVDVFARASNFFDWVGMKTVGRAAQNANWRTVVERMVEVSGGTSEGVQEEKRRLDDQEATHHEERVKALVQERKRDETRPT